MEAANRGAADAGAPSIGFNIKLPHEQEPNAYSTPDLTFQFHYFAMRKMHLAMRAAALVVFPGGFGTFDELFEILNLVQTGKMQRVPIICFDREYWTKVVNFPLLIEEGMISAHEHEIFSYADDAEAAWAALVAGGLKVPAPCRRERPASPRQRSEVDLVAALQFQNVARLGGRRDLKTKPIENLPHLGHLLGIGLGELAAAEPEQILETDADIAAHRRRLGRNGHLIAAGAKNRPVLADRT